MIVRRAREGELDAIARLVAELQGRRESHIAFFGDARGDIAAEIAAWGPTWFDQRLVVAPLVAKHHAGVVELHERLFPDTYFSGAQLLEQAEQGQAVVLALVEAGAVTGYATGRVDPTGEGYLDFVGVAEEARGAGRGRRLVTDMCRRLLEHPASKVALGVYEDNLSARSLYEQLGFVETRAVVGYRRRPSAPA